MRCHCSIRQLPSAPNRAPRALAAADMVLVRIAYAADLPTPGDALRQLGSAPAEVRSGAASGAPRGRGPSALALASAPVSSPVPQPAAQVTIAAKVRLES